MSGLIIASIIIGVSIGGNIWWAQRDRMIDAHLQKQMSKMTKMLEELTKKSNCL